MKAKSYTAQRRLWTLIIAAALAPLTQAGVSTAADGAGDGIAQASVSLDSPSSVPAGALELQVNTTTGDVQLVGNNVNVVSIQITSASDNIVAGNWQDLNSNGYTNWSPIIAESKGVAEYDKLFVINKNYATINGAIDYGQIFKVGAPEDLVGEYGAVESNDRTVDTDVAQVVYDPQAVFVPEPTTLALFGMAAAGLMARSRRLAKAKKI